MQYVPGKDPIDFDIHRLPVSHLQERRITGLDAQYAYGVNIHAHAYSQLQRHDLMDEAGPVMSWLFLLIAALLGGGVALALQQGPVRLVDDLFTNPEAGNGILPKLRLWPWPALAGFTALILLTVVAWFLPYMYPVAGVLISSGVAGLVVAVPAYRARQLARRVVKALVRVDTIARSQGEPAVVRLPPGGTAPLLAALALPTASQPALEQLALVLQKAIVESGKKDLTFLELLPVSFYLSAGWLHPDIEKQAAQKPQDRPQKADWLRAEFIGTAIRRIRNWSAHRLYKVERSPEERDKLAKLANDAFERLCGEREPLSSDACLRGQVVMLMEVAQYLEKVAEWLSTPHSPT